MEFAFVDLAKENYLENLDLLLERQSYENNKTEYLFFFQIDHTILHQTT